MPNYIEKRANQAITIDMGNIQKSVYESHLGVDTETSEENETNEEAKKEKIYKALVAQDTDTENVSDEEVNTRGVGVSQYNKFYDKFKSFDKERERGKHKS